MRAPLQLVLTVCLALLTSCGSDNHVSQSDSFIIIGTGGVTGVYYPTGGIIATLLSERLQEQDIRAMVQSTTGSVYNVNAVLQGDCQLGIVQSDRQYQAVKGLKEWEGAPQTELRAICRLHPEVVTLVAGADTDIRSISDLKGKQVYIGGPGSGQRTNSLDILQAFDLDKTDIDIIDVKAADAPRTLQAGRIDAYFYTVGHPSGNIKEATVGERPVRIVPIAGDQVEQLIRRKPFYSTARIPMRHYPRAEGNQDQVDSFGVTATLLTSTRLSADEVYLITKTIFENLEIIRQKHPALEGLQPTNMVRGFSAPLHAGAKRYYQEIGMLTP
jgi:uncharacterized protein